MCKRFLYNLIVPLIDRIIKGWINFCLSLLNNLLLVPIWCFYSVPILKTTKKARHFNGWPNLL
ncbi:MAG: hypothetical protein DUD34_09780 [Lactobacillus sp.]|jgi:hypothetical protein|nr:MAG: hypothetical protein DUD34_09780 [Lactobacillus sp.]